MVRHLNENELAEYADILLKNTDILDPVIEDHVATCIFCKVELMNICDLLSFKEDRSESVEKSI